MKDREFDILVQKYNKAISNIHDLQNTLETKEEAWQRISESTKKTFKLTRSLCEMILAKDKREMKLGAEYSWGSLGIDDLISNAMKCFKEYNEKRTQLMNDIIEVSEERLDKIEDLEEKIEALMTKGNVGSVEESSKFLEEMDKKKEEKKAAEKLPNKIKEVIEEGGVQAILEGENDTDGIEKIENDFLSQLAEENEAIVADASIPVKHSKKSNNDKKKIKNDVKKISENVIDDLYSQCDKNMLEIIKLIGETGISKFPDISKKLMSKDYKKNAIALAINKLQGDLKLIETISIKHPTITTLNLIKLSSSGIRLYNKETNKEAVISEIDKIYDEYNTLEHGYGILTLKEFLEESGNYKKISIYNKKNPIVIEKDVNYIPDIICDRIKGNGQDYFEYEIGGINHTEFQNKCNKMLKKIKTFYFIGQNKTTTDEIKSKIESWIDKTGIDKLKGLVIKITSIKKIQTKGINDVNVWEYIYNLSQSREPIVK